MKKETESVIIAAQDQAISTNNIRKNVYKEDISSMCRMCGKSEETFAHILNKSPNLAQNEYKKWRHDQVAKIIHWELCKNGNLSVVKRGIVIILRRCLNPMSVKFYGISLSRQTKGWNITDRIL